MSGSSIIGNPPANQHDLDIVKGLYAQASITSADLSKGFALPPVAPLNPSQANKGPGIIAGLVIAMIIIVLITEGRLLARWHHKASKLGLDDAFIVMGAAGAVSWLGIAVAMVPQGGLGQHIYNITYEKYDWLLRLRSIDLTVFFVTVSFTQLSIVCFNQRLTGTISNAWKWTHRLLLVAISIYLLVSLLWSVFLCSPPAAGYSLIIYGENADRVKCLSAKTMTITLSGFHVAFNFILLSIPIIVLPQMTIPNARKLFYIIPMSVGAIACIASIMRLYNGLHLPEDITYNWDTYLHWTVAELVALVCVSSLPALQSALMRNLPNFLEYWGNDAKNCDEFGRPLNGPFYRQENRQANARGLRSDSHGELVGGSDIRLERYPIPRTLSRSTSHNTLPTSDRGQVPRDFVNDDPFPDIIGRGRMDNQAFVPKSRPPPKMKVVDPSVVPNSNEGLRERGTPITAQPLPNKFMDPGEGSSEPHAL